MIRVLSPEVVNQIAAGEVVERPFSVVKELVENALDAGAERLVVELEEGGKRLIRVRDDGRGMPPPDLELAFVSHATSKLSSLEDLDAIVSLGFRGEALASIGSVSRARILSRTEGSEEAHEVRVEGGRVSPVVPAAGPRGTTVEVRDLFFNTPARRRFLRTAQAERTRCFEVLTRLALANPSLGLEVPGSRPVLLPPGQELEARIAGLFGEELRAKLLPVEAEREGIEILGFVGDPDTARRDRGRQFLFLNGRPIQDRSLAHAVQEAFREYLMQGRHPVYFLHLSMDPREADVNVHPTKSEVRFRRSRLLWSLCRRAVLEALEGRRRRFEGLGGTVAGRAAETAPTTGFPVLPKGLFGDEGGPGGDFGVPPGRTGKGGKEGAAGRRPPARGGERGDGGEGAERSGGPEASKVRSLLEGARRFLVLHDCYLLLETGDGFAVVDQHALHERVIYEKLLDRHLEGEPKVQRLLLPAVCDLPPGEKERLLAHRKTLEAAGLLIEDFGGNAVKLEGYPACLRKVDPRRLLEDLGSELAGLSSRPAPEVVLERFHSAACRSAVMSGDRLTDEEIVELLEQAARCRHPDNCPHGRPTVLNFGRAQLERWFRRRV